MVPSNFEESNGFLNKPPSMSAEECEPLCVWQGPMRLNPDLPDVFPIVVSCWKLTAEELAEINRTARVWLMIVGNTMPPVILDGLAPQFPPDEAAERAYHEFVRKHILPSDLLRLAQHMLEPTTEQEAHLQLCECCRKAHEAFKETPRDDSQWHERLRKLDDEFRTIITSYVEETECLEDILLSVLPYLSTLRKAVEGMDAEEPTKAFSLSQLNKTISSIEGCTKGAKARAKRKAHGG